MHTPHIISIALAENGFRVSDIYKGLTADKAGLKTGDIMLEVDGKYFWKMTLGKASKMFMLDRWERILKVKRGAETIQIKLPLTKVELTIHKINNLKN